MDARADEPGSSTKPQHRVLACDKGKVAIVNDKGQVEWEYGGIGECHDIWMLASDNILLPLNSTTIAEVTPEKKIVWRYQAKPKAGYRGRVEVHAFQRLENGLTAVAESGNSRIVEVDHNGKIVHEIPLKVAKSDAHRDTRMVRHLKNDHYLVCHEGEGRVCEYDHDGNVVWNYALDLGGRPRADGHGPEGHGVEVFGAVRLPSGNTLIAGGNNNRVLEVNPEGKIVWSIEHNELPGIQLGWLTSLHVLPNGNIVFGNCHAGPKNPQLIEVNRDKKVVWTFKDFKNFCTSLAVAAILDEPKAIR
ncbi:PQQ-like beta-propeller repeat protein [soil metagenome]